MKVRWRSVDRLKEGWGREGVGKLVMVIGRILKHPSLFKNSSRNLV